METSVTPVPLAVSISNVGTHNELKHHQTLNTMNQVSDCLWTFIICMQDVWTPWRNIGLRCEASPELLRDLKTWNVHNLTTPSNLYKQKPESVIKIERYKLILDFKIQTDRETECNRLDFMLLYKDQPNSWINGVSCPLHSKVVGRGKKIEKYHSWHVCGLWEESRLCLLLLVLRKWS